MKYGKKMTDKICEYLRVGVSRTDACILSGVGAYSTFCEWMKKPKFSKAVEKAEMDCKLRNISLIQAAANGSAPFTRANAFWAGWWLERKYRDEFALKEHIDVTTGGQTLTDAIRGALRARTARMATDGTRGPGVVLHVGTGSNGVGQASGNGGGHQET